MSFRFPLPKGWIYRANESSCLPGCLIQLSDPSGSEMPIALVRSDAPFYREIYYESDNRRLDASDFLLLRLDGQEDALGWEYSKASLYIVSPNPFRGTPGQWPLARQQLLSMQLVDRLREGVNFGEHLEYLWSLPEFQKALDQAHEWQVRKLLESQSPGGQVPRG